MSQALKMPELPVLPQHKPWLEAIAPYVGGKSKVAGKQQVMKLSSNETPLGPSPDAMRAYIETATQLHRYPDGGFAGLREAIAAQYQLPETQIVCGNGSDELIGLLCHAYAGPGDEVLFPEHGFLMYRIYAQSVGATPVTAPEKALRTDVDALLAAVTSRTKIVFLANPNNPTGSYIPLAELQRLRAGLPEQVLLVIDGAYAEYVEAADYSAGIELVANAENTVMTRTFSKIYGLAALRLGWAYCPAQVVDVLQRVRSPFNVNAPAQAAGIAAIQDTSFLEGTRIFNTRWREWLASELRQLGLKVHPSVGNFLLVAFEPKGEKTAAHANRFLLDKGIIVREVANYGLPDCLRITIGREDENRALAGALGDFLKQN